MAKDVVRTRNYVTKMYKMRAQLQAVGLRLQTLKSTAEMMTAMRGVTRVCFQQMENFLLVNRQWSV